MAKNEARLGMDISDFEKKLTRATNELNKFARGGAANLGNLGNAIGAMTGTGSSNILNLAGSVASLAGAFGLTASAVSIVGDSINTAMNFEKSMSSLRALTGLGEVEMQNLRDSAIELGSTTTQSASQVADAFKLIGSAKPELLGDVDALKQVTAQAITLSEAAGIDVTQASAALTTSLNQMGEGADEAERYINVLAAGSQKGAGDINWLNEALTQSATAAKAVGTSYEELVSNLEQLAQAGFQAGASGTAMRSIIMSLEKQSNDRLKPSVVGMTTAFRNLGTECNSLTDYQKILGKEMAAQGKVLADNATKAETLRTEITGTNTATEQAKINTDNFSGSLTQLGSAWEGLMLKINSSNGILRQTVDMLREAIDAVAELLDSEDDHDKKVAKAKFLSEYKDNLDNMYNSGDSDEKNRTRMMNFIKPIQGAGDNDVQRRQYELLYQMALDYIDKIIAKKKEAAATPMLTPGDNGGGAGSNGGGSGKEIVPAGSIADLKKRIQEAEKLAINAVGEDAQVAAQQVVDDLKTKLAQMEAIIKISIEADKYDPLADMDSSRLAKGAEAASQEQAPIEMEDAEAWSSGKFGETRDEIAALNKEMADLSEQSSSYTANMISGFVSLGDTLMTLGDAFDNCKTGWDYFTTGISKGLSLFSSVVSLMETVNTLSTISATLKTKEALAEDKKAAAAAYSATATTANAGAAAGNTAALESESVAAITAANAMKIEAAAAIFAAHAYIPFAGVPAATAFTAQMMGTLEAISAIPLFAEGTYATKPTLGVFGEAGPEFVLPEKKLDEAFDRNGGTGIAGEVEFKIRDSELVGILKQYNSKTSRRFK